MIAHPVNQLQDAFNALCVNGGGVRGGPNRTRVQEQLRHFGQILNRDAQAQMDCAFEWVPGADPWHVSFAMGLCWGSLAKNEEGYFKAAIGAIEHWNDEDRVLAGTFHLNRGAEPIQQALLGAHIMFGEGSLAPLPDTLEGFGRVQDRWLSRLDRLKPPYIGPWNALALFMSALFTKPDLARTMREPRPILPTGGPISAGLSILYRANLIGPPAHTENDGERFAAIGAAFTDNALMAELLRGLDDWSMLDVHSGIYLLGTRDPRSRSWID